MCQHIARVLKMISRTGKWAQYVFYKLGMSVELQNSHT